MKIEDYSEYYIQGSDYYLIPKDVFKGLFNEMINWKEESQRQKKVIDKIESLIKSKDNGTCIHNNERRGAYTFVLDFDEAREFVWNLEDILKEVSECNK